MSQTRRTGSRRRCDIGERRSNFSQSHKKEYRKFSRRSKSDSEGDESKVSSHSSSKNDKQSFSRSSSLSDGQSFDYKKFRFTKKLEFKPSYNPKLNYIKVEKLNPMRPNSEEYIKKLNYLFREACFFIMKSMSMKNVQLAQECNLWATFAKNRFKINRAFQTSKNVILLFSATESHRFSGFARVCSEAKFDHSPVDWELPVNFRPDSLEGAFNIDWISKKDLPFAYAEHLHNSWNENERIKVARDGQLVEPVVGKQLCQLFPEDKSVDLKAILKKSKMMANERSALERKQQLIISSRLQQTKPPFVQGEGQQPSGPFGCFPYTQHMPHSFVGIPYPPPGYPLQGYSSQGHPSQGYPAYGGLPQGYPPQCYLSHRYHFQGYQPQGYPPHEYPPQGDPLKGYLTQGYPPEGYLPQDYLPLGYPPPDGAPGQANFCQPQCYENANVQAGLNAERTTEREGSYDRLLKRALDKSLESRPRKRKTSHRRSSCSSSSSD